ELACEARIHQDETKLVRLIGECESGCIQLVAEAPTLPIDEDRALLEQLHRGREGGGEETHDERSQQRLRHVIHGPFHGASQPRPRWQASDERRASGWDEAYLRAQRQI